MKEFEWVIEKHLNELLIELKKCKSKKSFFELSRTFYSILNIVDKLELNVNISNKFEYELNKMNIDKYFEKYQHDTIDNIELMYDFNLDFSKIYLSLQPNNDYVHNYFSSIIDIKNSINLAKSFFEYYDNNIYHYFDNNVLDNGLFILTDRIDEALTFTSDRILPPYSFLNPSLTAKDFISIVHETSHSYIKNLLRYMKTEDRNKFLINNFEEVFPSFIELVAIKYLRDNGNPLSEIGIYEGLVNKSIVKFSNNFYYCLIDKNLDEYRINEAYTYGRILSYHFFDNYLNDEEKTKKDILDFTIDSQHYDKEYLLNHYGLNQIELLNPYKLVKHMK